MSSFHQPFLLQQIILFSRLQKNDYFYADVFIISPKKLRIMSSLQPDCTLWKKKDKTKLKNVCTVSVPAGKTLSLRSGDPSTSGNATTIRYDVITDAGQGSVHDETHTEEFPWDSKYHEVTTIVVNGPIGDSTSNDTTEAGIY